MSADFGQDTRLARLHTALGGDVLVLRRFGGVERLNGLFEFRVEALSDNPEIDFDELLGTHATVEIKTIAGDPRFFDGIITTARWAGTGEQGVKYEFMLRPWFWIASKRRQQRIFHEKTAPEIIEEVLGAYSGSGTVQNNLKNSYDALEYTVQYGESDFDFVCRMMERFGINYHFEHDQMDHKMVLTDNVDDLPEVPGATREFIPNDTKVHGEGEHFWSWQPERNFVTGSMRLTDYNFKTPDAMMEVDRTSEAAYESGQLEGYDFPGKYLDSGGGKGVVALRLDQEQGADQRHRAIGDCVSVSAGSRVSIKAQYLDAIDGKTFVCLKAEHYYEADAYGSGGGSGSGTSYTGNYVFVQDDSPVVPLRRTPTPVIVGPQTAVVVGDGEIDCDEFGRVLVLFHWDLAKANSMRVRSSQSWAHKGWGGITIPRIGMEVIVEFLNGDPDMPIITGHVYNGKNMPPYELPANKTRTSFKTKSHQAEGFNEIRFEDEGGKEEIFIHAQKDRNEKTLNNWSERTDNNFVQSVGHNKSVEVKNNHAESIGGNMTLSVGPSGIGSIISSAQAGMAEGIGSIADALGMPGSPGEGNLIITVEKSRSQTIGTESSTTVGINSSLTVGKAISETAGISREISVGKTMSTSVGKTLSLDVGEEASETVGKKKTITVGDELAIVVGKASIIMKKDGTIQLKGKDITVDGSGNVDIKSAKDMTVNGGKNTIVKAGSAMTVKAGGAITIKGSKINQN
ncbi:type VI secretion system Vgr family protein [Marivivens marinus]|uniref:type VI secretion system Vgr family protein n=1 Tax=Marivivens marinus TaxID=3110173 RepID=UPI003B8464B4